MANRDGKPSGQSDSSPKSESVKRTVTEKPEAQDPGEPHKEDINLARPLHPEKKESELTPDQKRYLLLAATYLVSAKQQGRTHPILDIRNNESLVGHIKGRFQITQILGPSTFIANLVDSDGIPIYSVWVEGVSTAGQVDGGYVSFKDDMIFLHKGTKSYRTVLQAVRTIYSVETINDSLMNWAIGEIRKLEAELKQHRDLEQRRKIEVAQTKLNAIKAELKQFEAKHARVAQHVSLKSKIAMYEPHASNERIAPLLKQAKEQLEALGEVSKVEAEQYKKKRIELLERKREALIIVRKLGG
jgi:hypothetical protein